MSAKECGRPRSANPYVGNPARDAWFEGWHEVTCEFCEPDGQGQHAPRCPVTLEAERDRLREVNAELVGALEKFHAAYADHPERLGNGAAMQLYLEAGKLLAKAKP